MFLERQDRQVKIRGHRIELTEIEQQFLAADGVVDAFATLVSVGQTEQLGIVAAGPELSADSEASLARFAAERLPSAMRPSVYQCYSALPLNRNGKLDRGAMRDALSKGHSNERDDEVTQPVYPRDDWELKLAGLWAEQLGCEVHEVPINRGFADLGGDSILGLQLIARARMSGIVFSPKQLFAAPSIEALLELANYPAKAIEERVTRVWSEVLERPVEQLGRVKDFLALGGDSILALQVIAQVRELGIVVTPKQFFANPTIAAIASCADFEASTREQSVQDSLQTRQFDTAIEPFSMATVDSRTLSAWQDDPNVSDAYPATATQRGMLFHSLLSPGRGLYTNQFVARMSEVRLEGSRLQSVLTVLAGRHSVLRSRIHLPDSDGELEENAAIEPHIVVDALVEPSLSVLNWRDREAKDHRQDLKILMRSELDRGIDLLQAPLMRLTLIETRLEQYLLWTFHHAVLDGWSIGHLVEETFALYSNAETKLPERLDVSRYVQWLGSQDLPGSLREWKAYLEGFEEPNALPLRTPVGNAADKAVSAMGAYRSTYTAELTRSSVAAARTAGVTHNTLLQAAWSWLIANLSRQWDVVFGVTLAGRPTDLSGADGMIGAFINTVPLRIEMTMDETVTEFVQSLQRNAMALQERSFVPLMDIQRQSDCKDALFQSLWVFENHPIARPGGGVGGLFEGMEVASADTGGTELPLTLWVYPGEQLRIHFTYDAALVDAVQVERIATLMSRAVALVVDGVNDSLRLSQLCLADASDQRFYQNISDSAKSEHDGPDHLYARFLTAAHSFAERVAVRADGPRSQQLSYGELAQRVNQLAHHLLKQDLGRGDRVAVHVERGADMLVAVLAVQAIGAAYVPLDTSFPAQRLAMIVEDAQPGCLLDTAARPLLCELPQPCRRLVMDDASITSALARYPNEAPNIDRSGEDVAYVIYTSGSTGRPKGVVIRQRSLVNLLLGMQAELELQLDDRMLAVTSLSFDIATVELYLPLLVGAETVIAAAHQVMDAEYLASRLAAEHPFPITTMQATPASWELLLQAGWRRHSDLTVLCGGEALSESLATALLDSIPASAMPSDPAPVFNCYGPTETTVWSALNRVCPDTLTAIGRPLANNALRVLGEHGQLQPVGVAGELWIGGRGVASGYHERPELTADRFRWMDGELWYGTGDLALLDKNGQYHCLGRLDHQVKIRGFRIELGDIEAALLALPAVAQACVVVRYRDAMNSVWRVDATSSAEPQLVAYWVPAASHADAAEVHSDWSILQGLLRAVLPEYMVPGHAVAMPALPLTPNGKVDRRSLPAPEDATPGDWEAAARWLSAADSLGQAVYQVFAQTLGIEQFSPAAHFFDLGGHSLLAMQAVARLQRLARDRGLGDVDVQLFFESPTVIGIHERLAAMDGPGTVPVDALLLPPPLQADQSRGCAPLSFAQQRLWAADQLHSAGSDVYNMAAAVRLTGQIDWQKLERAFVALLERQTALRTALLQTDFGIEQRVCDLSSFQLPRLTLNVSAREQDTLVEEHFHMLRQQPFQLDGGCLLRVQALDFGSEAVLLLCVHHIAFDAWSAGVLLRDLSDSYLRQCSGQEGSLATLPVDYLDYANWQRSYLKGRYLEQRLDFWRQQMAGAPESLALPFARPQQDVASAYAGGEVRVALEAELLDDLRALARDADATLFMVLSAVYYTVLRAFTGHEDVVFGTDVANRLDPSLESVVGFFVNVVPLRFRQPGSHSFRQLMSAVRSQLLEVYRHQDVPFDRLVDELGARGQQGSNPLVQSLLVLQNAPFSVAPSAPLNGAGEDKIVPPGMTMLDLDNQVSRFDVSLFATESGGGLSLVWKFRRARYQERDVQQLATAFVALVRRATSDPEVSVQSMCDELAERRRCDTLSHRKKARRRIGRAAQVSESSSDHLSLEQHSPVTKESMEP
ncbi:MAG: amino acid adenylation domain-containing protein [Pseudomonadota bacterium]